MYCNAINYFVFEMFKILLLHKAAYTRYDVRDVLKSLLRYGRANHNKQINYKRNIIKS
jgi:hypothetical protein